MAKRYTHIVALARVRVILALVVVLGILAAAGSGGTLAYFTSTQTSEGNTFTTGSVTLNPTNFTGPVIEKNLAATTSYLNPGDDVFGSLVVENTGKTEAWYSMKIAHVADYTPGTGDTAFEDAAKLTVQTLGTDGTVDAGTHKCTPGADSAKLQDDKTLTSLLTGIYLFGSADNDGTGSAQTLTAGSSQTLCFHLELPVGVAPIGNDAGSNAFKDTTVDYNLTAIAVQKTNRP
jgi:predicted ribosomally synthesized peptide with SipW-like signal peptide